MVVGVDHTGHLWQQEESIHLPVCLRHDESGPPGTYHRTVNTFFSALPQTSIISNHRTFISREGFLLELRDDPQVQEYMAN